MGVGCGGSNVVQYTYCTTSISKNPSPSPLHKTSVRERSLLGGGLLSLSASIRERHSPSRSHPPIPFHPLLLPFGPQPVILPPAANNTWAVPVYYKREGERGTITMYV